MVKQAQAGAVVGVVGTVLSCSAMMFSLFPALLGVAAASASTGMAGMAGSAQTTSLPGWVTMTTHYSAVILGISVLLMLWAVRRSTRTAKVIVGGGIVLLIVNELSMSPYLFLPALGLIIVGNVIAWRHARPPHISGDIRTGGAS